MGKRVLRWSLGLALVALLLAPALALAAQQTVTGAFTTSVPPSFAGHVRARADEGVVHLRGGATVFSGAALHAESLVIEYTHANGTYVRGPAGIPLAAYRPVDDGRAGHSNVQARIEGSDAPSEMLALVEDGRAEIEARTLGRAVARAVAEETLVRVGDEEDGISTPGSQTHGFSYTVPGTWPALGELDSATITGTFTVFINNVTIRGDSDEGSFEQWSGARERPDSSGTVVEEESYLVLLHVRNGTLVFDAPMLINLVTPSVQFERNGVITAHHTTGQLQLDGAQFGLRDSSLKLQGTGEASIRATGEPTRTTSPQLTGGPAVVVETTGVFEVSSSEGPGQPVSLVEPSADRGKFLLIGLAVGVLGIATLWQPAHRVWDQKRLDLKARRINAWLDVGDRLVKVHRYDEGATWYRRVTTRYPRAPEGWHALAECLELGSQHGPASEAFERLARLMNDDPHVLIQAARAAARADAHERAVALVLEVAEVDPEGAQRALANQPHLSLLRNDPRLQALLDDPRSGPGPYA